MSRRNSVRGNRGRISKRSGAFVAPPPPVPAPAAPTLTAPGSVAVFNTIALTVSATSTDSDLDRIDWVLDGVTVVATDSSAPYSQSWTPTGVTDGDHALVARAVRGALSTDSAPVTINVGEILHTLAPSVTCLRAWQSDFGVTDAGGGVCSSWTDLKNSTDATQATGSKRPTIVANAYGKHPAIRFDGVDDTLNEATLDLPSPATTNTFVWFVFNQRAYTSGRGIFNCGGTAGQINCQQNGTTPQIVIFNLLVGSPFNSGAVVGTLTIGAAKYTGSTSDSLRLGASSITGVNVGNANPGAGCYMGSSADGANTFSAIDLVAKIIFAGVPSAAELAALSAAAAAMYPGVAA